MGQMLLDFEIPNLPNLLEFVRWRCFDGWDCSSIMKSILWTVHKMKTKVLKYYDWNWILNGYHLLIMCQKKRNSVTIIHIDIFIQMFNWDRLQRWVQSTFYNAESWSKWIEQADWKILFIMVNAEFKFLSGLSR